MPTLTLTWVSMRDTRVCPICLALEGFTWVFETGKDQLTGDLIHPEFGVVWNVQSGSEAHGHHAGSCRCHLEPEFDFTDLLKDAQDMLRALEEATQTSEVAT